ncbi:MAG: SufS family cysteine desulfurase [Firmicutes bacterium]|nr:SufS family cysteine desulfurase [Bacillota bacterium]
MEKNLWREDFPQIREDVVYLDTAAMSLKPQSVIDEINHYYSSLSVNIHRGLYQESYEATKLYEEARARIAKFINASIDEIIFTRGATSALNLVANSYGLSNLTSKDEIITSELEHHSSLLPWQVVSQKTKASLKYIELSTEGRITVENFKKVLNKNTKVVALTFVSNVMGYVTPMKEIIELAHKVGAIVVVDAAQAIQHMKIDVIDLDPDFLAFSGHKMLGPTGIGVLYGKKTLLNAMEPCEFGGDMNDQVSKDFSEWKDSPYRFEAGTMPVASAIGMTKAVDYLENIGLDKIDDYIKRLYRYTYAQLKKIPEIEIYNPNADMGIIAFNIKNVPSHDAVSYYAENHISIRSGHHCAQLVTKWLNIAACLRASFYLYNTFKEADKFIQTTKEAVVFFHKIGF